MQPPAGRIQIGDCVEVQDGRRGRVTGETPLATNGAWRYAIRLEDGSSVEHLDFEVRRLD